MLGEERHEGERGESGAAGEAGEESGTGALEVVLVVEGSAAAVGYAHSEVVATLLAVGT